MRTIELVKGIHSSVLGFGCAPILGSVDSKKARRSLEVAFEHGINHLDLARSYGYGEAENFVGKVIKGRRDKIVLASKFGIAANWKAKILGPVKPLVRILRGNAPKNVVSKVPATERVPTTIADRFHDRIPLRSEDMRRSLERSLQALRTDYLDYFFIHEPPTTILHIEELMATAELLKSEGKIRGWGLAYMRSKEDLHLEYLHRFDVLQFDNSPGAVGYDRVVATRGLLPNIIFSPLRGGANDMKPAEKLQKLFTEFPNSVVLCSMYGENHIVSNAKVASEPLKK